MHRTQTLSSWFAVSLVALSTLSVKSVRADEGTCQTDTDCGKGWSCQATTGGCAETPSCPQDAACAPVPPCVDVVVHSCVPATCTSDTDCADGMLCHELPVACPGVACPKDAACPPVVCDPGPKQCTYKYELPCSADADCGAGFSCAFGEACSGGTAAADAGTPTPAEPPSNPGTAGSANLPPDTTTCTTSTIGSCRVTPVPCQNNTDCQTGWSCSNVAPGYGCAESGSASAPPAADGGVPTPTPGSAGSAANDTSADGGGCPPPPAPVMQCVPPGYSAGTDGHGVSEGSGTPTGTGNDGTLSIGGAGSTPPKAAPGATTDASSTDSNSASCSVSVPGGTSRSGLALLALGLLGFVRRRRLTPRA